MDRIRHVKRATALRAKVLGKSAKTRASGLFAKVGEFIDRGNVVDLAVGVIIGAASGAVVSSIVEDIFSPFLGLMSTAALHDLYWILRYPPGNDSAKGVRYPTVYQAKEAGAITMNYGRLLEALINLMMVGICLFGAIKLVNVLRKKAEEPAPSTDWPCPKCREMVKEGAVRCPHCTSEPICPPPTLPQPDENPDGVVSATSVV